MRLNKEKGIDIINKFVSGWTQKYQYLTTYVDELDDKMLYFSNNLPTPTKPVPIATVKVFFTLADQGGQQPALYYRFEKNSLIHTQTSTIRISQIQQFIERLLHQKLLTRQSVFFLGTDFQRTRIQDQRLKALLYEEPKPPQIQKIILDKDLARQDVVKETAPKPRNVQQKTKQKIKILFDNVDIDKIGIISTQQFHKILDNMEIGLSKQQKRGLISKADLNKNGAIKYSQYCQAIKQLVKSLILKDFAVQVLNQKQQQFILQAKLILHNDPVFDIKFQLQSQLKKQDQQQTGFLKVSSIRKILQKNYSQTLNTQQLSLLIKALSKKYGYNDVPIVQVHNQIIQIKIFIIKHNLFQSNQTLLQMHIIQALKSKDKDSIGKLTIQQIMSIFDQENQKLQLSKVQKYAVRSILVPNQIGKVQYADFTKLISQTIKAFFMEY